MIKKTDKGYSVDVRPAGRNGRRFRKTFATRAEATVYERYIRENHSNPEPWETKTDKRRLSDLAQLWYEQHGQQLKSGAQRLSKLEYLIEIMGNPRADQFTQKDFANFRTERLKTVTANTVNHDQAYLRGMFNELKRLGEYHGPNPIDGIRSLKIDEPELGFLDSDRVKTLLDELDQSTSHAKVIARVCLATGARWGEASTLNANKVRAGKVHFSATKSGKNRSIPISNDLEAMIKENLPIVDGLNTFKRTIDKLGWQLPKGQSTHILRHTFASHFMMNGGNILTLQRVLGHSSLTMTMRYAHLAPEHLSEVLELNPLS
ncbi:phage integrase [Reinekea thalattae]|uniref:Tyrosine-type recombinase/integrase n=1 Tax=Reinekea thalattae TaxID=2593301 RepID=A0A5C8Z1M3_9GAMM|nr:tyrosine-type recombinase/integrase [Reinekea thalattae]TXR52052.1 tyrosine-type recombinase/integrase [Reinekea thalattae]